MSNVAFKVTMEMMSVDAGCTHQCEVLIEDDGEVWSTIDGVRHRLHGQNALSAAIAVDMLSKAIINGEKDRLEGKTIT